MPFPQSSSTCCRAINRRLLVQHDCVWVPESALSAAYERYCSASRIAFRRHGSSVPGPLENRKRQNKRQMGELTFGHAHGSAPLWDLENLPDLTQWKWKPPTERRSRQTVQADRNLWNAVVAWLSPRNDARSQSVLEQPASTSSDILQDATPITMADPTSVALGSDTESAGWIEQGFDALIQDVSLDRTLRMCPNFSSFCDTLRDGLSEGRISAGALCSLVPSMADGLARSALTLDIQQEKKVFERLKAQFIGASIDGLEALRARLGDTHFDGNVWEILLQEASHLRFNSLRTFARLMSLIPSNGIGSLSVVIHANLNNFLAAVSQDTHRTHEKQINKLAGIIQDLGLMEHRHILDEVLTDLAQNTHSTNFTVMRFCWLQVLARLRSLDDEALANACVFLETGITAEPLTSKQIARIFLGRQLSGPQTDPHSAQNVPEAAIRAVVFYVVGSHGARCESRNLASHIRAQGKRPQNQTGTEGRSSGGGFCRRPSPARQMLLSISAAMRKLHQIAWVQGIIERPTGALEGHHNRSGQEPARPGNSPEVVL
ncbi:hypothetical protein PG988_008570 [Apiospora saccharicola]